MGGRGATPGKRLLGLRVVARDGARLTGDAVFARNAMREIEVFLPLSFLGAHGSRRHGRRLSSSSSRLLWSGIFLFFPLFNRDRLRVGDLRRRHLGGPHRRGELADDLVGRARQPRRTFPRGGARSLRRLRAADAGGRAATRSDEAIVTVAASIRPKAGLPDDGDDFGFLSDYYAALCAHLEAG